MATAVLRALVITFVSAADSPAPGTPSAALLRLQEAVLSAGASDGSSDFGQGNAVEEGKFVVGGSPATITTLSFAKGKTLRPDAAGFDATGAQVWASGLLLQMMLGTEQGLPFVEGRRCIELGAGTGIVSIAAARLGAASAVATDGNPVMVALADYNGERNLHHQAQQLAAFASATYLWGGEPLPLGAPFETVLLTDVLYCKNSEAAGGDCSAEPLLAAVAAVCADTCDVLLAFERRSATNRLQ